MVALEVSSDQVCTITATYGVLIDTYDVTIQNNEPQPVSITVSGPAEVDESTTTQYTCMLNYDDGSEVDITGSVKWRENSGSALIGSGGALVALEVSSDQVCTITATYGVLIDTYDVTIQNNEPQPVSITVSGPAEVDESTTTQYTCMLNFDNGSEVDITGSVKWRENSGSALISSGGALVALEVSSDQVCTITATYGVLSDTYDVTIQNNEPQPVSITVSGPAEVDERYETQYTCMLNYNDEAKLILQVQ